MLIKRLFLVLLLISNLISAQTPIRYCTMEDTCTWFPTRIPGTFSNYTGGNSSAIDLPANELQYASLDTAYRLLGTGIGSSSIEKDTLVFPNITGLDRTKRYTVRFKLASIAYNPGINLAAGVDITDTIKLEWTASNGVQWFTEVAIIGNNNSSWGFNGTGLVINKLAGLSQTTYISYINNPVREVNLTLPLNLAQVKIRIPIQLNAIGESFLVDDVQVLAPYWQLVANVQGAGNSSVPNDYNYIDSYPVNGTNYYVLTQTDYDGRREQFPPIVVMFAPISVQSIWDRYNFLGQEIK